MYTEIIGILTSKTVFQNIKTLKNLQGVITTETESAGKLNEERNKFIFI